ncbi:hypothetical protein ACFRAE_09020 [Sphingobacterium sp. HJSM2_6]|uniref:hypothetical protein n=1 Tax=Sphingobacterium sp. HJSM2_6 TaxID=3366264 RepID=UPI003BDA5070
MGKITNDGRMGSTHIAIYTAIWMYWMECGKPEVIHVYCRQIMPKAKIRASSTYYGCLGDLHGFGYLQYYPSYNRNKPSCIILSGEGLE